MTVLDKMRQNAHTGAKCRHCTATATECQIAFIESKEQRWCCSGCAGEGPMSAHADAALSAPKEGG